MSSVSPQQEQSEDVASVKTDPDNDPDIFCFNCDYNLTYCVSSRCPECGESFDRDELLDWSGRATVPFDGLLSRGENKPAMSLWRAALFHPARLGREIPAIPDLTRVREMAMGCRLLALAVLLVDFTILVIVSSEPIVFVLMVLVMGIVWGCSRLVEVLAATLLESHARWCYVIEGKSHPLSEAFSLAFAVFLPIYVVAITVGYVIAIFTNVGGGILLALVGGCLWWWLAFMRATCVRAQDRGRCVGVMVLILICTGFVFALGVFGLMLVLMMMAGLV